METTTAFIHKVSRALKADGVAPEQDQHAGHYGPQEPDEDVWVQRPATLRLDFSTERQHGSEDAWLG